MVPVAPVIFPAIGFEAAKTALASKTVIINQTIPLFILTKASCCAAAQSVIIIIIDCYYIMFTNIHLEIIAIIQTPDVSNQVFS